MGTSFYTCYDSDQVSADGVETGFWADDVYSAIVMNLVGRQLMSGSLANWESELGTQLVAISRSAQNGWMVTPLWEYGGEPTKLLRLAEAHREVACHLSQSGEWLSLERLRAMDVIGPIVSERVAPIKIADLQQHIVQIVDLIEAYVASVR